MKRRTSQIFLFVILAYFSVRWYFLFPQPDYSGTERLPGIKDTVEVYTDSYGVPHIFAKTEKDLFYTTGFIIARERLFQLSIIASAVRGELTAFVGEKALADDIYLRTWRIPETAKKLAGAYSPEAKIIIESFCLGINDYIDKIGSRVPIEFKLLRQKPIKWRPEDVAGYSRLMAHNLQQSWKPEMVFGAIREYFGDEKLEEIIPAYENHRPTIASLEQEKIFSLLFDKIWQREQTMRSFLGGNGMSVGSNNGVISGSRTESGKPILMNDPHLSFSQPTTWFEAHLTGGRFNVSGVLLVGMPIPVIGQNERIAWGFTNVMTDDIDFFVETIHPEIPNLYKSGDKWLEMDFIRETIPLQNGKDTTITIRQTYHGPVISDIHPLLKNSQKVISMAWTGHWLTHELDALINLAQAKNWEDFSKAVADFAVPGQNIVYADIDGNIGWRPATHLPIRKNGQSLIPRPGEDPSFDWTGKVPFNEMPYLYNPPKGFIITANNKTVDDRFPYYISNLWADPSRAIRLEELVGEKKNISVDDIQKIQTDIVSPFAKELTPYILATEKHNEKGNLKTAFELLKKWKGDVSADSKAALVFHVILNRLIHNIYEDEFLLISDHLFEGYTQLPMITTRNLLWIIENNSSSWFDDIQTKNKVESRDDIIYRSIIEAVNEIEEKVGKNPGSWSWGRLHTLTHNHKLGQIKILDWMFGLNVGPFPNGGSSMTVNNGEYNLTKPYIQIVGPSMRRIVDFEDLNATMMILPTGQSGIPQSRHYDDQADMFIKGEYRQTYFDEKTIRTSGEFERLLLIPGKE